MHIGGSVIAGAEIDHLLFKSVTTSDGFVIKRDQLSVIYDMPKQGERKIQSRIVEFLETLHPSRTQEQGQDSRNYK